MTSLFTIFAVAALLAAGGPQAGDATFDARVSAVRRHMRSSCQSLQAMPKAPEGDGARLADTAVSSVAAALEGWNSVVHDFAPRVPEGYAGDPAWTQRLEDLRLLLGRMGREIAAGEHRSAFLSCAHACNVFAALHEANGVVRAIDPLFVLRKRVLHFRGLLASAEPERARSLLRDVLSARDTVLLVPAPAGPGHGEYIDAVREMSLAADRLAQAARDRAPMAPVAADLAARVERAYELAL